MKHFSTGLILFLILQSCKENVSDCNKPIDSSNKYGFMAQGGFLDKYDDGNVYYSIVHIVDPRNWDYNEFFTGDGFSTNEDSAYKVLEKDSCELKHLYFKYLEAENQ